jgi:hypothetical protein
MSEPKHASKSGSAPDAGYAAEAEARVRAAFETVRKAVSLQTHADGGSDPVAVTAVAANARLAMAAGGAYLVSRLDPATPSAVATAVRTFAELLEDIAMNALAGVGHDDPVQAGRLRDADAASARLAALFDRRNG